jgi:hypothetical protein
MVREYPVLNFRKTKHRRHWHRPNLEKIIIVTMWITGVCLMTVLGWFVFR